MPELNANRSLLLHDISIAGVGHANAVDIARELKPGEELGLAAEPSNPFDENAVLVLYKGAKLGYIPKRHNAGLSQMLQGGAHLLAVVDKVDPDAPRPDLLCLIDVVKEG